jgi:hypothetical protein
MRPLEPLFIVTTPKWCSTSTFSKVDLVPLVLRSVSTEVPVPIDNQAPYTSKKILLELLEIYPDHDNPTKFSGTVFDLPSVACLQPALTHNFHYQIVFNWSLLRINS